MNEFHFLRPLWFLALPPLAALLALLWRRHLTSGSWRSVVDPQLLPHLLIGSAQRRSPWAIAAIGIGGLLAITALAGPVWNKLEQPVFRRDSALVVLLDLSRSMNAADLSPSRLQMAKFKLRDLLARRKEGETALVVYAADPFTVTPLTNDTDNIARQLPSLTTDLMPAQGSRADRAIVQAEALLRQAGAVHGDVLLITDGIDNTPAGPLHEAVSKLLDAGYRLSVLGVGTADGAPIPLTGGGFFQDDKGAIVVAKLDQQPLARLAAAGHGIYRQLTSSSDGDTDALAAAFTADRQAQQSKRVQGMKSDQWREEGPWLLLPLLPLAALAFRRGYLLLPLLLALWLPLPRNAYAFGWNDLWQRPDQRAAQAMAEHHPQQAAKLFHDPQWRAAAHYRAGDYQAAANDLKGRRDAVADYNRGNALAHLGKLPEALNAYDAALKKDPQFTDAAHNRDLVRKWLKPPQQQKQSGGKGNPQQKQGTNGKQQQNSQSQQQGDKQADKTASSKQDKQNEQQGQQNSEAAGNQQQGGKPPQQQAQQQQAASGKQPGKNAAEQQDATQAGTDKPQQQAPQAGESTAPQSESQQATEQWLRRIPDDPGGLWRRKFLYQYKREYRTQQSEAKPW